MHIVDFLRALTTPTAHDKNVRKIEPMDCKVRINFKNASPICQIMSNDIILLKESCASLCKAACSAIFS